MGITVKAATISALILGGIQFSAAAQKNEPTAPPAPQPEQSTSFEDLLNQIRENDGDQTNAPEERPHLPRPADLPTVPAPNTPPVFPVDDGDPRELPWYGVTASTTFVKIDDGVEHTFSKYKCADKVAGFQLEQIGQITNVGEAISCKYYYAQNIAEDESTAPSSVHILIFKPPPSRTIEAQMAEFRNDIERDFTDARIVSADSQIVTFVDRQVNCPSVSYDLNDGVQSLTNTICQVGDWRLRFRQLVKSDDKPTEPKEFMAQFAVNQAPAVRHVDRCTAFIERLANETPSGVTGISYNAVAFPYTERGESCYAGHTSSPEGSVLVRYWPDNPDTPITLDLLSPNGQYQDTPSFRVQNMWANVPAEEAGPAAYLLMREQANGAITVYQGYTRIPTDARTYQDATQAYAGEIEAIFLAKQNESGGWTMMAQ